ncbi:sensor histidine kinase [Halalkalibacter akibai]|uniref:histidine kinase n=1 Tax=Halalkalibacter akibai (strain ATCC 43226 / DSM 21942 / CIP 109018 / JCM 9157 / 1139) TaxID=1236973 RepID=W4QZX3_HALA3|nr:ATP-binding protein [Halalkalibacter akibai]GAE37432.1 two-component sensor histidine kinase [Halalkalibacter akibai JCM 9157]
MKKMSFRNKILIVLLLTTMILSSFSFILLHSIDQVNTVSQEINQNTIPELVWLTHWQQELLTRKMLIEGYIENNHCCYIVESYQSFISTSDDEVKLSNGDPPKSLVPLKTEIDLLDFAIMNKVQGLILFSDQEILESYLLNEYLVQLDTINNQLNIKKDNVISSLNNHTNHFSRIINESLWLLLTLTIAAVIAAVFSAYRISSNLTQPIERLVQKVDQIANGHYGMKVEETAQVEFRHLTTSINKMSLSLKESFETILKDKIYREQILNSLPVGIITFDKRLSNVSLNQTAKQLLGSEESVISVPLNRSKENKMFWDALSSKEIISNVKIPYYTSIDERSLLVSQSELLDQNKDTIGRIFYFIDITETENLEKRMHHSEKLALVGELAAGAAHEIRNPLTVIDGFLNLMNSSFTGIEKEKFHLPLILKELERINAIIEEMLLLTKPSAPHFKELYLEDIINDILPLIRHSVEYKNVEFLIDLERVSMRVDEKQMKQVFHNLIRNSIESMEEESRISIYSRCTGNHYEIYVEDSGKGIPKFIQSSVFDPFLTSKETGTGLGLTIVQRIIDNHGGHIKLASSNEEGTTFVITLPLK